MKQGWHWAIAAGLAVGGIGFVSDARGEDRAQPAAATGDAAAPAPAAEAGASAPQPATLPAGIKAKDAASDNQNIRETFEDLMEAGVEENSFDDLVERLVDQDRNRIGKFAEQSFADLNAQGAKIRQAWREKFDANFEADSDDDFRNVAIVRGEITEPKQVATSWPLPAVTPGANADAGAVQAASTDAKTSNDDPDLNSNIEAGREVAVVTLPASHGMPALNVSLMKEARGYRIDAPNTLTGQQLHDNLLKHITHVAEHIEQWPADRREAARMLSQHVLMAVYGVDVPARGDAARDREPAKQ